MPQNFVARIFVFCGDAVGNLKIAGVNILLLFLLHRVERYAPNGPFAFAAGTVASILVIGWTVGIFVRLRAARLPMLGFYFLLLAFGAGVEYYNFGYHGLINPWLVLIGSLFALHLVGSGLLEKHPLLQAAFSTIFAAAAGFWVFAVFCYNLYFGVPISSQVSAAVLGTTLFEAREFIADNFDYPIGVVLLGYTLIVLALNFAQYRVNRPHVGVSTISAIAIVALVQLACFHKPAGLYAATIGYAFTYFKQLRALHAIERARQDAVPSISARKLAKGETYVLVIGESQARGHMSLYGYERKTTPWMDDQVCSENWARFTHSYSNYVQTVPALSLALTAANQYNGKNYIASPSILDVARSAGFRTYWLSNQQGLGTYDNPITAIANTADVYVKINHRVDGGSLSDFPDIELVSRLRDLKRQINPDENNLIVLHLMGSHQDYCRRFPSNFSRFSDTPNSAHAGTAGWFDWFADTASARRKKTDCYDDSVAFTDLVLSQIFSEAKQLSGFRAFVYLPDHAEGIDEGRAHDPQMFTFEMTHIPLIVWLSDAFTKASAGRTAALRNHRDAVWTNDLLYELILGLTGIEAEDYDPRYDLSSERYSLDWDSALTQHGAKKVEADPTRLATSQRSSVSSCQQTVSR